MKKLYAALDFKSQTDQSVLLEVSSRNEPILFGLWSFNIRLGNKTLLPESRWTKICEHTENHCDYTEIELHLAGDYRLQRSLLLNHKDQILLLGDAVLAEEHYTQKAPPSKPARQKKTLSYRSELYVSPKLRAKTYAESSEIDYRPSVRSSVSGFRTLPLALPEWKNTAPGGSGNAGLVNAGLVNGTLTETDGVLTLYQETSGRSLFAPLLFDLDADRLPQRYTWRALTVGENMQRVAEDRAVGYRIHLGQSQFLLYRSLTSFAGRTVLGHNLIDEFCFARFDPDSGVEPLIAINVAE